MEKPDSSKLDSRANPSAVDWQQRQAGTGDLLRAAAYSAIQVPGSGIDQIVDKVTRFKAAQHLSLVDKPDSAEFGTVKWHVQQVGHAVGGLVPFLGALALTRNISSAVRAEELALAYSKSSPSATASIFRTGEMTAAGFMQGTLLEPNQNKDQLVTERLRQGITSGVTMGSMHVLSNKISTFSGASAADATLLNKSLTTALAGGASGVLGFKVDELLSNQKRSNEEFAQSVYQATFAGAALGGLTGAHLRLHRPAESQTGLAEYVARDKSFQIADSTFFDYFRRSSTPWRDGNVPLAGPHSPFEVTNLPRYSPMEKAELVDSLHRDADPLLRKPEVIQSFIKKIEGTWTDDLARRNAVYGTALDRAHKLQQSLELQKNNGTESRQDGRDYAAIKRLLKKQDAQLDKLMDSRDEGLAAHRQRIENATNEFLAEQKLPSVKVRVIPSMHTDGAYSLGEIHLNGMQLEAKSSQPVLINHIYHELTHLRQDVLTVRLLADELGLPQHPSSEQVNQVKEAFLRHAEESARSVRSGDETVRSDKPNEGQHIFEEVSDFGFQRSNVQLNDLVDKVLALRSAEREPVMSGEDKSLAQRMRQGANDYLKQIDVEGSERITRQLDNTSDFVQYKLPEQTAEALNDIVSNPKKFQATYGFSAIPAELEQLAREHNQNANRLSQADLAALHQLRPTLEQFEYYDSVYAKVSPIFVRQHEGLLAQRSVLLDQKMKQYMGTDLEKQAFPTGTLAELSYRVANL